MKNRLLLCLFLLLSFRGYSQCTLTVAITQSSSTICSGNSIVLTATPSGGTAPFTYVWSTGETTASISVNKSATYTVSVTDKTAGCQPVSQSVTVTSSASPSAPTAANQVVCHNNTATLTATAPGGNYQWYDSISGGNLLANGDTYTTQPITAPTNFYVQTTVGDCTSPRTEVQVTLNGKPVTNNVTVCEGNPATLTASGGDSYTWYSSPNGGTPVGTGPTFVTPPLTATTAYYVAVTANGCTSALIPVYASVSPPPQPATVSGVSICSGTPANLHADVPAGYVDWFDVPNGGTSLISSPDYTTPPLTATTTYYAQTTLNGCVSSRVPLTVTVDSPPQAPAAQTDSACYQTSIALTAGNDPSLTYEWYSAPSGGNPLSSGATFNTPVLTNSTLYYVQVVNGACISTRALISVIVKPLLSPPTVSGAIVCPGGIATLTATSPGGSYQWYNVPSGGSLLASTPSYTTPALTTNTTYYVQRTYSGCVSPRTAVTVTVSQATAPPTASGTAVCFGNSATLSASSPSNIYAWYDSVTGGNLLSSGQVYVTPPLTSNTTYYVETSTANGCASTRTAVTVTVNPVPSAPASGGASVCPGSSATLTASASGGTIKWYDAASGGTLLATGSTYTTPALTVNTTYYVQNSSAQCTSSRTPVTVSIIAGNDPQFQYSSGTYCVTSANPTPVINNPAGGAFSVSPAGLVFVSTTTGEINIAASTPGNYVVSFLNNSPCQRTTTANITITTTSDAHFSYAGPFCQDGVNPLPVFPTGASSGTFTSSPSGLVFLNTSTGEISLVQSAAGTYTLTNNITATGQCPASSATGTVTIYEGVSVYAGPNQDVPTGSPVQLSGSVTGGATSGTWTGGTGSFSNPSSLSPIYTPGPGETQAILTLTSANPAGPCGSKSSQVAIHFNNMPAAPTASGTTICSGSSATLSATAPGPFYGWYDAATGGNKVGSGPSFTTPPLIVTTTYYVDTNFGGITSNRTAVTVVVNAEPAAPTVLSTQTCTGTAAILTASGSTGTYQWYDSPTGGNLLANGNTYTTPDLTINTSYYVQAVTGTCTSTRTQVNVTVTAAPNVSSSATGSICSGTAQSYAITADLPSATFTWSRAQVAGISNPAVSNQTSSTITETLINPGSTAVNVTYTITPLSGACSGPVFNYVVTVNPVPTATSVPTATVCNGITADYAVTYNIPGTVFSWSRAAVPGISNAAVNGQAAPVIKETLFNTTNNPVDATYTFISKTNSCDGVPFNMVITVNPADTVNTNNTTFSCSNVPENHLLTSNIPSATFSWGRAQVAGISNPAVSNQTSSTINETLINTTTDPILIRYIITPSANGCPGPPYNYFITVYPTLLTPVANSNSPVCSGNTIHLTTTAVVGATYLWTGPNGFSSAQQNVDIANVTAANSGTYSLVVMLNGCTSSVASTDVLIDQPPVAVAGPDQVVCIFNPTVKLSGSVSGGTSTGIWSTVGTGTFSPSINALNAIYTPSAADKAAGSVVLTLSSTSKDDCSPSVSSLTIRFGPLPAVNAGPDQAVCIQDATVQLNGSQVIPGPIQWTSSGTGHFTPSDSQLNAQYVLGPGDVKNDSIQLKMSILGAGPCYFPSDSMIVKLIPPPTLNAGGTRYVLKGRTITLNPVVSTDSVTYLWSPNVDINDVTLKNPTITGDIDRTYTLTVTDVRGCTTTDSTFIKVSPAILINNTFTPNGDEIDDFWDITGLIAYVNATVDVFNRYGTKVFHSIGYPTPWDGKYGGQRLPVGVYYYVVNLNYNGIVLSGYVTIIR